MAKLVDIPYEQQFTYLLNKRQEKDLEQQILDTDFTEENLDKLRVLFKKWQSKKGVS